MMQEWRLVVKHYAGCKINRSAIELDTFLSATTDSGHSWQKTLQLSTAIDSGSQVNV